jgi:hypothetical protein
MSSDPLSLIKASEPQMAANLASVAAAAESQLAAAGTRNQSFEARALGLISFGVAVPTLYLLVRGPLQLAARTGELLPSLGLWVGTVAAGLSIVAAIIVSWPVKLAVLTPAKLSEFHQAAGDVVWMDGLLTNHRLVALRDAQRSNRVKGQALRVTILTSIVAIVGYAVAVVAALPVSP